MKKQILTAGFVLLSCMLPLKALAVGFSQIFVFGDSLSDIGNVFDATGVPPSPPYFQGRFSNGPVWVEYFASNLGLSSKQQTNFAFGGATTGIDNTGAPNLPGLSQQIKDFTAANLKADLNALYVVWAGANDYLGNNVTDPSVPVINLTNAVTSLATANAKNIIVINLPDLGKLPGIHGDSQISTELSTLTAFHNSGLSATLAALSQQLGINIIPFDISSLFNRMLATPEEFGFTNLTDSCLNLSNFTTCPNPNEYLFWDDIHPTTRGHWLIAESALSALKPALVREPCATLGMLTLGVLGVSSMLKRKQK